jgi:hypothetical protein
MDCDDMFKKLETFILLLIISCSSVDNNMNTRLNYNLNAKSISLSSWIDKIYDSESNRSLKDSNNESELLVNKDDFWKVFDRALSLYKATYKESKVWIKGFKPEFFESGELSEGSNILFAQRLEVLPKDQLYLRGDLHGDVKSLGSQLLDLKKKNLIDENFVLQNKNISLLFLGDYVDRGHYGLEVIYTLLRLKLANPTRVHLVRGNHEDTRITRSYGFDDEVERKLGKAAKARLASLYEYLPSVIYIGYNNNYVQACHGGLEPRYYPFNLLHEELAAHEKMYEEITFTSEAADLGFMWSDFTFDKTESSDINGKRDKYSCERTKKILNKQSDHNNKIIAVIRAHQHGSDSVPRYIKDPWLGLYRHWVTKLSSPMQEIEGCVPVWTFNLSSDSPGCVGYGMQDWHKQTLGELKVGESPKEWKFERLNLDYLNDLVR